MATTESQECQICLNTFTKQLRRPITCPACEYSSCAQCIQRYILSTVDDPNCPNCHHAWTNSFIQTNLSNAFLRKEYTVHRANILWGREESSIPFYQQIAERRLEATKLRKEVYLPLIARIAEMQDEADKLAQTIYTLNIYGTDGKPREKAEFTRKCTVPECKGWLSTAWKCSLCTNYSCPDCFAVIGPVRTDTTHTCNPDDISTANMIRKSTKPCPKCGEGIEKKDGCDMMFCTACTTPFEWSTGKIVTHGRIHNPHYYEWLGRTGAVREHGDIPCGGIPTHRYLTLLLTKPYQEIAGFHDIILHVQEDEMEKLNNILQNRSHTQEIMIDYLIHNVDKNATQHKLRQYEVKRNRVREFYAVFQTFVTVGAEYLRTISDYVISYYDTHNRRILSLDEHPIIQEAIANMLLLIKYINTTNNDIASSFGIMAPLIALESVSKYRWVLKRVKATA